jgi:hypothetical protein
MTFFAESELVFYRRAQALLCAQSDFGSDNVVLPSQIGGFESAAVARAIRVSAQVSNVVFVRNRLDAESLRRGSGKHGFSGSFVSIAEGASFAAARDADFRATRGNCPGFVGYADDLVRLAPQHEQFRPCFSMLFRDLEVWASAGARLHALAQDEATAGTARAVFLDSEASVAAVNPDEVLEDATVIEPEWPALLLWGNRRRKRFISRWQVEEYINELAAEALALRRSLAAIERNIEEEREEDESTKSTIVSSLSNRSRSALV